MIYYTVKKYFVKKDNHPSRANLNEGIFIRNLPFEIKSPQSFAPAYCAYILAHNIATEEHNIQDIFENV